MPRMSQGGPLKRTIVNGEMAARRHIVRVQKPSRSLEGIQFSAGGANDIDSVLNQSRGTNE